MDTFEDLNLLLSAFGLSESTQSVRRDTLSNSRDTLLNSAENGDSENEDDLELGVSEISVDDRVDDFFLLNIQQASGTTVATDEDDPQSDLQSIKTKLQTGCGCKNTCFMNMSEAVVLDHILDLRAMEKSEKEMFIMGTLSNAPKEEGTAKQRERERVLYTFKGKRLCRHAFLVIYDLGKRTLEGLLKHMKVNGIVPRIHGLSGKISNNALSKDVIKNAVLFLQNYASEEGLPQPSPQHGRDGAPPVFLPASNTKQGVYKIYRNTCVENDVAFVGLTTFKDMWKRCMPHVKIMNPKEDVCSTCEDCRQEIVNARTEEDKLSSTSKYHQHIENARAERAAYERGVEKSSRIFKEEESGKNINDVHYTFDFSQYVKLPHHSREKGPTFFIQPRKIQIFGFRVDGFKQFNYLIDEDQTIGKDGQFAHGPDSVISMLDHALSTHGLGEDNCEIHADNCFGQNKNRYVMAYLSWRTMTGRHKSITYMMQLPGHTRCLIDAGFGRIKQLYRRSDVDNIDHVADIVCKSSHSNTAIKYGEWSWRQWKHFFADRFKKVEQISKYHYFRFDSAYPGKVFLRKSVSDVDSEPLTICKTHLLDMNPAEIPDEIPAGGLSTERQKYLHKHVRPLVRQQFQERFCPLPDL